MALVLGNISDVGMKWETENEAKEIGMSQVIEDFICPIGHLFCGRTWTLWIIDSH